MRARTTSLARGGLTELCVAGLEATAFRRELRRRLTRLIDFDAACINTVDPDSRLINSSVGDGLSTRSARLLFELEERCADFNLLATLVAPVSMHRTTEGVVSRSTRMREIFLPLGWRDELRAPLRVDGVCWGYLHLFRGRAFASGELALIGELESEIAKALRAGCAIRETKTSTAVGMMMLDASGNLTGVTAEARAWLEEFEGDVGGSTPHVVQVAALRARSGSVRVHHRTPRGVWMAIHASPFGKNTALTLSHAHAAELAPMLFRAHGLTNRERAVAGFLAAGHSNESIAAQLELRVHTVKDHVKTIFAKTRCAGRIDFVTRFA